MLSGKEGFPKKEIDRGFVEGVVYVIESGYRPINLGYLLPHFNWLDNRSTS